MLLSLRRPRFGASSRTLRLPKKGDCANVKCMSPGVEPFILLLELNSTSHDVEVARSPKDKSSIKPPPSGVIG